MVFIVFINDVFQVFSSENNLFCFVICLFLIYYKYIYLMVIIKLCVSFIELINYLYRKLTTNQFNKFLICVFYHLLNYNQNGTKFKLKVIIFYFVGIVSHSELKKKIIDLRIYVFINLCIHVSVAYPRLPRVHSPSCHET